MGIKEAMKHLLQQSVKLRGMQVGRVVDVIFDPESERVVGYEVRCRDQRHRFLPAAAASEVDGSIAIDSPFALLDTDELDFYRRRGKTLRTRRESAA
jgi:sporulation protein YlmC with PRC-barrel domain